MPDLNKRAWLTGKVAKAQSDYNVIRPPYSGNEADFIAKCTQCNACIDICPTKVIQIGNSGYPELNFQKAECEYCQKCVDVCQPSALSQLNPQTIQHQPLINSSCLTEQDIYCRSCAENCEPMAIQFTYKQSAIAKPKISLELCTSCGACAAPCPVDAIQFQPTQPEPLSTKRTVS